MPAVVTDLPQVALAGNPNAGKTSIFNLLTGASLKVGNYAGVTVERHSGKLNLPKSGRVDVVDIPGTYSLSARSPEEQIASRSILGLAPMSAPDLVVIVVDCTQLLRNLYLALQILETGVNAIVAVTMVDLLANKGQEVNCQGLARILGVPVVSVSGRLGTGMDQLREAMDQALQDPQGTRPPFWTTTPEVEEDLGALEGSLPGDWKNGTGGRTRALAAWALLSIDDEDELLDIPAELRSAVARQRQQAGDQGRDIETEIIQARYRWIDEHCSPLIAEQGTKRATLTSRIDSVLLNPVVGFALFLLVMGLVFQSLFSWADPAIGVVEGAFGWLSEQVVLHVPEGLIRDFITEGLIAGVGGVVVFLPQILILFFFIGLMEDSGYMARIAFLMDRIMKAIGLHGRAFVPMLSGLACAVPAIMATRTMERRRDRMITMMAVPLMSCSARLPVYTLLIAALYDPDAVVLGFLPLPAVLMVGMYLFSTGMALVASALLGRTLFQGPKVPLILELPPYRVPQWRSVLRMMANRSGVFLREAGGVILVCTIGLWLLLSFPKGTPPGADFDAQRTAAQTELVGDELDERLASIANEEEGAIFRNSYGARLGKTIEPVIEPLGFDWKIGIGLIGAFAAREVFVSTMGIVYGVSGDVDEESTPLREKLRNERWPDGKPIYTPLVGLSLMIFFALACQCMSTLAAVYRETHSWRWPTFMFVYMTGLAWVFSFAVYQGGRLLGFA